jgi:hypothetical protein
VDPEPWLSRGAVSAQHLNEGLDRCRLNGWGPGQVRPGVTLYIQVQYNRSVSVVVSAAHRVLQAWPCDIRSGLMWAKRVEPWQ